MNSCMILPIPLLLFVLLLMMTCHNYDNSYVSSDFHCHVCITAFNFLTSHNDYSCVQVIFIGIYPVT